MTIAGKYGNQRGEGSNGVAYYILNTVIVQRSYIQQLQHSWFPGTMDTEEETWRGQLGSSGLGEDDLAKRMAGGRRANTGKGK